MKDSGVALRRGPGQVLSRLGALPVLASRTVSWIVLARWVLVASQAATIIVTWPLWQVRTSPPMLPALDLPQVALGGPLLISLLLVLRFPLVGALLHAGVLMYSMLTDQVRMQPELLSMAFLLLATSGRPSLLFLGRIHLLTLWAWAGLAKLVSPNFMTETGPWMFDSLFFHPPEVLARYFGAVVIFFEMGAGVTGIFPDLRRYSAGLAVCVHAGILIVLGPLGRNFNTAIWPWNIALIVCAIALIGSWSEGWRAELASLPFWVRGLAILLVIHPVLFYFGKADAYLTHHLYSGDTTEGFVCDDGNSCTERPFDRSLEELNVPFPPHERLFRDLFLRTCRPGETLKLLPRRIGFQAGVSALRCPG